MAFTKSSIGLARKLSGAAALAAVLLSSVAPAAYAAGDPKTDARNFEGVWTDLPTNSPFLLGIDLPYKPEAQDIAATRLEQFKGGHANASPHLTCRPTGVQGVTSPKGPVLIMQTPEKLVFVQEEDREVRKVYFEDKHPADLKPTYSGDAIAHWEGNTLVIDTIGYNGKGQMDEVGNPHGARMHMVQRVTKSADGNYLTNEMTFTDPDYYTQPFTKTRTWQRSSGVKLTDYDCAENPREDLFEEYSWGHDWFRPVCVFPVKDGVMSDRIVCTPLKKKQP